MKPIQVREVEEKEASPTAVIMDTGTEQGAGTGPCNRRSSRMPLSDLAVTAWPRMFGRSECWMMDLQWWMRL